MARGAGSRGFGNIRKLPSGRHQASYSNPDGRTYLSANGNPRPVRYAAPTLSTAATTPRPGSPTNAA